MNENKLLYNLVSKTLEPTLKLHQRLINGLTERVISLTDRVKAVETLLNNINEINYINNDDDGVADGLELDSETNYLNNNKEIKNNEK